MALLLALTFPNLQSGEKTLIKYKGKKLNIYILIGQSNMAGRATITTNEKAPIKNVFLLNDKGLFEQATTPMNRYSTISKGLGMQKLGPGYGFAKYMIKKSKRKIGLIVNAKGGTSIKSWAKGKPFYKEIMARIKLGTRYGRVRGILWHQGEADFKDEKYLDKLIDLIKDLRKDLKNPRLPFVAGEINNKPEFNKRLNQLPKKLRYTAVASSKDLKATDMWHFDTKSQLLLGERYAQKMKKFKKKKK